MTNGKNKLQNARRITKFPTEEGKDGLGVRLDKGAREKRRRKR